MVDLKKILRKAFDKPSLEDENWLEPSDSMLEQIEGRIYVKKKKQWWLFIVPVLLIVLTAGSICLGSKTMDGQSAGAAKNQFVERQSTIQPSPSILNNSEENLIISERLDEDKTENKTPIISVKNNLPKTLSSSAFSAEDIPTYRTALQNSQVGQTRLSTQNNFNSPSENILDNTNVNIEINESKEIAEVVENLTNSIDLKMLDRLGFQEISSDDALPNQLPIEVELPKKKNWDLVAGTSVSFWQFKLNDAYQNALAPADFQFSNGLGLRTFIGIDRKLGRRFSLGAKLAYENIGFSSGHNSTLDYDRNAETDSNHSNTKMVMMATPVGFVDSDLTINRDTDLAGSELLIDIKNRHRIQSLDLQLNMDYQLPQVFGLSPKISLGAGVQYITKLTNELKSFTPQQSDFSEGKGAIVTSQSSLNLWSPTITTGFGLEKKMSKNISIGINGGFMLNLNALQEVDEFSTRLNRFNGGVYLRRNF